MKLKVSLKSENKSAGCNQYHNEVNASDFTKVALILLDLKNNNVPIDKAYKEYLRLIKTDWDVIIGN